MESKIDLEQERKEILAAFKGLLRTTRKRTREETQFIRKAFDVAVEAHKEMRRKSGEPYIYHPIAVARICGEEMGLGPTAIACALLHDTVEDTHITLNDIEELFGERSRVIIDGLTKIPEVFNENSSIQAENFRKMILTISDDLRVVLIKLADRLHNMRTLSSMRPEQQIKIASETKFLYAPLAHRLGLYNIKSELEDLSMMYTEPEIFKEIQVKLKSTQDVRTRFIRRFVHPIREALLKENFDFEIKARTKSIASIWRKMQSKELPFEEIFDLFAIRIILNSPTELEKADCWRVYSVVTDFYQPSPDRLRDWISTPRANGYESLHTTVMSPQGKWVEVQIRTNRMDEIAEKGLAAHYRYKESNSEDDNKFDRWIAEIRDLLENPASDALEFVEEFKMNLFNDEIYVFTPQGQLRVLPIGCTILDFAYDIHSDIGNRCIGAKVNNRLVPLSYQLHNGEQVEIITSEKQRPHEDWLKMVQSARAKSKIKSAINDYRKQISIDGKEILERKCKKVGITFNSENIKLLVRFFKLNSSTDLYIRVAKSKVDLGRLRELQINNGHILYDKHNKPTGTDRHELDVYPKINKKEDVLIIGEDFKNIQYQMARCCNPIPGDIVFGFITINEGIKIHRNNCPNAEHLQSKMAYRCIKAKWKGEELFERVAFIRLTGIDNVGIVNKITEIVSTEHNVNMKSIFFEANDGVFEGRLKVMVYDTEHLNTLMCKFELVEGVKRVERSYSEDEIIEGE